MKLPTAAISRLTASLAVLAALAGSASAYYHFVQYSTRSAPFVPVPKKFDLRALPNNTVSVFVNLDGANSVKYAEGDTLPAILSEVRRAAEVWNGVPSSALRVSFGGLIQANTPQATPHVEVTFGEMPPGVYAVGGPITLADAVEDAGNRFVPILLSTVTVAQDLSSRPSYDDVQPLQMTLIHELGHALGLQHTFTSSTMSTEVTRAATRALPLAADDIAGLSVLYPAPGFAASTGSIAGRVTSSGAGVSLASVVALTSSGQGVSAFTNPDGTYRIDGLAPGFYMVYVHPLPPDADVVAPRDSDGNPVPASGPFRTVFYPDASSAQDAGNVEVSEGETSPDIDFSVAPRTVMNMYGVTTYSYPKLTAKPAIINVNQPTDQGYLPYLIAWLQPFADGKLTPSNLGVSVLGTSSTRIAAGGVMRAYWAPQWLKLDFMFTQFSGNGPRHLVFTSPDETYVLPSAFYLVEKLPPVIDSVSSAQDGDGNVTLTVKGSGLTPDTRYQLDGIEARVLDFDSEAAQVTLAAPPGPRDYKARLVALCPDGQSSTFAQKPPVYAYDAGPAGAPAFSLSLNTLQQGMEAMVELTGQNMTFSSDYVQLGLGTSDVVVKRLWVVNPNLLRANVLALPSAQPADTLVSLFSGFEMAAQPAAFHVARVTDGTMSLSSDVVDAATGQATIYPGGTALVPVMGLPSDHPVSLLLMLNDKPVKVTGQDGNRIAFQVPADMPLGPAVLHLEVAGKALAPVFVVIDAPLPVITDISRDQKPLDASQSVKPGDLLLLTVSGLGEPGQAVAASRLKLTIGGVDHPLVDVPPSADRPGLHQIQVVVSSDVKPGDSVPVVLFLDGRHSAAFPIRVAAVESPAPAN